MPLLLLCGGAYVLDAECVTMPHLASMAFAGATAIVTIVVVACLVSGAERSRRTAAAGCRQQLPAPAKVAAVAASASTSAAVAGWMAAAAALSRQFSDAAVTAKKASLRSSADLRGDACTVL